MDVDSPCWHEVSVAAEENRHELVISNLDKAQTAHGVDLRLFSLKQLNFLSISKCALVNLPDAISNLSELTKLSLQHNILTTIPSAVGQLSRLKFLDLSFNSITSLSDGLFDSLSCLETLMLDGNQLLQLPSMSGLVVLHYFSIANNELEALPDSLDSCTKLLTVDASNNHLTSLPDLAWGQLSTLTRFNVCDNQLCEVPHQMTECRKLRELLLERNPLKDNRLKKLAADPRPGPALINYLGKMKKTGSVGNKGAVGKQEKAKMARAKNIESPESGQRAVEIVRDIDHDAYSITVIDPQSLRSSLRPRIYACSVSGVVFKDEMVLKDFLRFQIKLHNEDGEQRRAATVCTHDEAFISLPLTYSVIPVDLISIHALNMSKSRTARDLLLRLHTEAEGERKRRKMTQFSSLARYLELISPHLGPGRENVASVAAQNVILPPLPTVIDAAHNTLSVHPLTGCNQTRLSVSTSTVLLEVAGVNEEVCFKMLRALISWLSRYASTVTLASGDSEGSGRLLLRPLRIINGTTGDRFGEYPRPSDLALSDFILAI